MNNDREEAKALASALVEALPEVPAGVEVCVCPPTIDLCCVSHKLDGSAVKLGAQNVYFEAKGAYTGETSVAMLKSVPVQYCIIGHSERRDYFHETDEARGQARCGRRPRGWRVPRGRGLCFDGREGRGVAPVRSRAVAQRAAAHSFEKGIISHG